MAEKERILVVDDEPSIRKYLQTLLEVDGYTVETVSSGKEALERVGAGDRPDFVILDVLMPELNGLESLRQMMQRSEEHTSELQSLAYLVCRLLLEKKKKGVYDDAYTPR